MLFKAVFVAVFLHQLTSLADCSPVDSRPLNAEISLEARAPKTFKHPGVFLDIDRLNFIRSKVNGNQDPWKKGYDKMFDTRLANPTRPAAPWETVECSVDDGDPNKGCQDERDDALTAYTMSLAWYIKRDIRYAKQAIQLMNAWARTIKAHKGSNTGIQTGWAAISWARAAEIIRYTTSDQWSATDMAAFEKMLRTVYLPILKKGPPQNWNGNWDLVMMQARLSISVYLEDRTTYDEIMARYRKRVQAYIYLEKDGSPKVGPGDNPRDINDYWHNPKQFVNGLVQETCRDLAHTGAGIAAIGHIAEIARIQGTDLYAEKDFADRMKYALELHSQKQLDKYSKPVLCNKALEREFEGFAEVGLNACKNRLKYAMPFTEALVTKQRPAGSNYLFVAWETLTHAGEPPSSFLVKKHGLEL